MDNTSAVAAVNKMGSSRSQDMDEVVHKIWEWAISKHIWITTTHIPGILNTEADKESRLSETRTEWMLNKKDFNYVKEKLGFEPTIDLFATRINTQLEKFVSYRPDPNAFAINAFTLDWGNLDFYAFPPFSCIASCLQKIHHDKASGVMIVPDWPNQPWYCQFDEMTINKLTLIPRKNLLTLPSATTLHPLHQHLQLKAAYLSGEQ